mmetsp:Transcript_110403/g.335742  ORF Transcript_110403/g.335742 Transcript_110403/m.335742 type:complete len:299 (-) Transcript_110403:124-1020(-)
MDDSATAALSGCLVAVTGAARGLGIGVCRQVLRQDPTSEVVVMARDLGQAEVLAQELGARAHPLHCDVTSAASCKEAAEAIAQVRRGRQLSLVNNAGVAFDLPWFPSPWPAEAARKTLAVNLFGPQCLTDALLPQLLDKQSPGRVIFVSSGAGPMNMKRMSEERRDALLSESLTWAHIEQMAADFVGEYEAAATGQGQEGEGMPRMSASGFWLQSYGFSKACLNAYCRLLAREHPSLLCTTCSPGFVQTDMVSTYNGDSRLRSLDEGGDVPAWLACGTGPETGCYYGPDRSRGDWVAA